MQDRAQCCAIAKLGDVAHSIRGISKHANAYVLRSVVLRLVEAVVVHFREEGEPEHRAARRGTAHLVSWCNLDDKRVAV